ncbi:MAG: RNA methyltransferase [Desulfobacterales bacterium]
MNRLSRSKLYLALLHYPVKNKDGKAIASAITSIDLHDIARTARTYGVAGFYVVTPLADQREFAGKIISHWVEGAGAAYNPDRKKAFSLIRLRSELQEAIDEIRVEGENEVRVVATSASGGPGQLEFADLRQALKTGQRSYVVALGTAWGLTPRFMEKADYRLAPVAGMSDYNHLSVRAAAAIILDRLLAADLQ